MKKSGVMALAALLAATAQSNDELLKENIELPSLDEKRYTGDSRGIYIPRKHTVDTYRGQQRKAVKRRNIRKHNKH